MVFVWRGRAQKQFHVFLVRIKFRHTSMTASYWLVVGTWLLFSHILGIIIPTDELIFFRGVGLPPASHVRYEMPWKCEDLDDPLNPLTWQVGKWLEDGWVTFYSHVDGGKHQTRVRNSSLKGSIYLVFRMYSFWLVSPFLLVLALWWHAFCGYGAEHATYKLFCFSMFFTNPSRTTAVSNTQSWLIV